MPQEHFDTEISFKEKKLIGRRNEDLGDDEEEEKKARLTMKKKRREREQRKIVPRLASRKTRKQDSDDPASRP